ncbi:MAG: hypothetical protein ACOCXH_13885 [Cyclobacteriaceae bacterium]
MKILLIFIASVISLVSVFANSEETILLSNEKKESSEKIKYLERKLFGSQFEDYWQKINLTVKVNDKTVWQNIFPAERYVSYNLSQPASPFVILVIPSRMLNLKKQTRSIFK